MQETTSRAVDDVSVCKVCYTADQSHRRVSRHASHWFADLEIFSGRPIRLPLSAFIVADMIELQQAHATHRFIVRDEEDDKPRILMWLFNPSVRLSYSSLTHYGLPEDGTIYAAKILFKIIGPRSVLGLDSREYVVLLLDIISFLILDSLQDISTIPCFWICGKPCVSYGRMQKSGWLIEGEQRDVS